MSHEHPRLDERSSRIPAARRPQREVGIRELRNAGKVVADLAGAGAIGRVTSGGRPIRWSRRQAPIAAPERHTSAERHAGTAAARGRSMIYLDSCAPMMRTLDAIHLVSAAEWDPSDVELVTYDRRLAAAATDAGIAVVAPVDSPPPCPTTG